MNSYLAELVDIAATLPDTEVVRLVADARRRSSQLGIIEGGLKTQNALADMIASGFLSPPKVTSRGIGRLTRLDLTRNEGEAVYAEFLTSRSGN